MALNHSNEACNPCGYEHRITDRKARHTPTWQPARHSTPAQIHPPPPVKALVRGRLDWEASHHRAAARPAPLANEARGTGRPGSRAAQGSLVLARRRLRSASTVTAHWPSRSSLLAALATGLLAAAFLWPRTRLTPWTAYAPGPPWTEVHLGPPGPWKNMVGLTTSYPLALLAGVLVAALVLSRSPIPRLRHRRR
jgi:hypothetical protein